MGLGMRLIDADKLYDDFIDDIDQWLRSRDYDTYCIIGDTIREIIDKQKTYNVSISNDKNKE